MLFCSRCGGDVSTFRVELDFTSLHEKLRTESGPSSVDSLQINSILESLQQDLRDLTSSLAGLDKETHRRCILEYAAQFHSLLAPIRKFPDEILQTIFDDCCDMNYFVVTRPSQTAVISLKNKPAMVLSSVCSRWRSNALSLPKIWSRLSIEWKWDTETGMADYDKLKHEKLFFPLSNFLCRSLEYPMTLNLIFKEASPKFRNGRYHPIVALVTRQTHRLQKVTCDSNFNYMYLRQLFPPIGGPLHFPILEDIAFLDSSSDLELLVDVAPKLKALTFYNAFPSRLTFVQLRYLELSPRGVDIARLSGLTPNLVSLVIWEYIWGPPKVVGDNAAPSSISSMHSLIVYHGYTHKTSPLGYSVFPHFRFPSLETLQLEPHEGFKPTLGWLNFDPFMAFVQRSAFPLTTLSIKNLELSDSNLIHLLQHVPKLRDLTVADTDIGYEHSPITERFVESLRASRASLLHSQVEPIVPRLHSLTLETNAASFGDSVVVDTVCSRWTRSPARRTSSTTEIHSSPVDCLREFTMKFRCRTSPGNVYEPLELIEKDGMRLVIVWKT